MWRGPFFLFTFSEILWRDFIIVQGGKREGIREYSVVAAHF